MYATAEQRRTSEGHRNRSASYTGPPPPIHQSPYRSQPPSPNATRLPPPSPVQRDRPTTSYYDPISNETRASNRDGSVSGTPYQQRSAVQAHTPTQPPHINGSMTDQAPQSMSRPPSQSSPLGPNHAHPALLQNTPRVQSTPYDPTRTNGAHTHSANGEAAAPQPAAQRMTNPMSMMNLLTDSAAPATPAISATKPPTPTETTVPRSSGRKPSRNSNASQHQPRVNDDPSRHKTDKVAISSAQPPPPQVLARPPPPHQTGPPGLTIRDTEAAWQEIQALDLSDVEQDTPSMNQQKQEWAIRSRKRTLELEVLEGSKRKRRRHFIIQRYYHHFNEAAEAERAMYVQAHEEEVTEEVRMKEVEEDKERKKDQQRKRRREKAVADEQVKRDEAVQSLETAKDEEERTKIEKDIQRFDKKIRDTQNRLQGITPTKEFRNESPQAVPPNRRDRDVTMEGGLMTSFYSQYSHGHPAEEVTTPDIQAAGTKRGGGRGAGARGGGGGGGGGTGRARKSKEQKEAEKARAAGAQAYIDQGHELPLIAPKEEERLQGYASRLPVPTREDSEPPSDMTPAAFDLAQPTPGLNGLAKFESKGYDQIYEQISKELAKQVPKVVRIKNTSFDTKQSNARKTAQLAAKEARRWQLRTNKSTKDVAARAKRAMREMLGFWKRNERDEREGRKVAEKAELDKAKKQEAEREANRQKRKLNFLISQTELYSHFIGKKVKTDEIERHGQDGDGVTPSGQIMVENKDAEHAVDLGNSVARLGTKVTKVEDLDFDDEDETAIRQAAMSNAQLAVQEAQDRARAFDRGATDLAGAQDSFDEGEMNFQNPTSLQSTDIAQPAMLNCQLKEYQLKGLNWLVNLYEQGINGILADEMGLGKTVQSISVMAYLAENHDIWGPFLVIAPASTLHNWQQEIARFVPNIKVLPYWGSARDRKVLRKFWDRKHITYTRDSPFHVLVTS
ncbi:putative DNA helicase ino80 [Friedmanniomyces endolithicus]|nr:putative DNA helicase ino80 [Friedmanniomyces endolithicus]